MTSLVKILFISSDVLRLPDFLNLLWIVFASLSNSSMSPLLQDFNLLSNAEEWSLAFDLDDGFWSKSEGRIM